MCVAMMPLCCVVEMWPNETVSISKKGSCWWAPYHADYLQKYILMDDVPPQCSVMR
jgi:hypothetical protein